MVDTITVSGMERTNYSSDLQRRQYSIGIDKIYFSKEDIGKKVSVKYIEAAGSTITEFRNEYGEWLLMLLKQRMKGERGGRE